MTIMAVLASGLIATLAMTAFMHFGQYFGLPKLDAPIVLGRILSRTGKPAVEWGAILDFIIGVLFAFIYIELWNMGVGAPTIPMGFLFGLIHGIAVLLALPLMRTGEPDEPAFRRGPRMWTNILIAHIIYAVTLSFVYQLFP